MTEAPGHRGFDRADPDPAALIESLRAFGYTPQTAVADLVDNSVTAKAKNVSIEFDWRGAESRIVLADDGRGMTESALVQAMRPGSQSPRDLRASDDLGRFGLGLKTASFSQCRRLTVLTKSPRGGVHARYWDLDEVVRSHEWRLIHGFTADCEHLAAQLEGQKQGTVVVWDRLDRLVGDVEVEDKAAHARFLELARSVREHLAMTFHRFLSQRAGITLTVNGTRVPSWDPFLTGHSARQVLGIEKLVLGRDEVAVRPFVLPHRSKLSDDDFALAGGDRGWNSLQGFYVYRNKRLLVAGDWLGLGFQKEEHYKLARIQVDISNEMDPLWQIDVRKSMARPPGPLRDELRRIAKVTRTRAVEVYRHRGKILSRRLEAGLVPVWQQRVRHGKVTYEINRDHPLVRAAIDEPTAAAVRALARVVEETVPVPLISIAASERPEQQSAPFEGAAPREVPLLAKQLYNGFLKRGLSAADARTRVLATDPFQYFPEVIELLDSLSDHAT